MEFWSPLCLRSYDSFLFHRYCLTASDARAGSTEPEGIDFWNREQISGDWWGTRSTLEEAGISVESYVIIDWSMNVRGGLDTEGSALRHVLSINVSADAV